MGKFSETLKQFQKVSGDHYQKLMDSLEEDHCWKCPMRSTSTRAYCRELHAWLKLQKALEEGIEEKIHENHSKEELDAITARFLEKRFKKEDNYNNSTLVILKVDDDHPGIPPGSTLIINPRPKTVKKNDLVLIPEEKPCPVSWFFKAGLLAGVPFKTSEVGRSYHRGPLWYLETKEGLEIPVAFLLGVVVNIFEKDTGLTDSRGLKND